MHTDKQINKIKPDDNIVCVRAQVCLRLKTAYKAVIISELMLASSNKSPNKACVL